MLMGAEKSLWASARIRFGRPARTARFKPNRGVAQFGQSIGLQNRGPKVRILAPLPSASGRPAPGCTGRAFLAARASPGSGDPLDSQFLGSSPLDPLGLGPLAQLAERRADNAEVGGSSPPRPTSLLSSKRPLFSPNVIAQPLLTQAPASSFRRRCQRRSAPAQCRRADDPTLAVLGT